MRLIDADAMIRKICGMKCGCEREECGYDEAGCPKVRDLETAPTVSPDEVCGVGKWLDTPYAIECSKCHEEFDSEVACCDIYGWPWKFCPKCGARMTEVSEDA